MGVPRRFNKVLRHGIRSGGRRRSATVLARHNRWRAVTIVANETISLRT
jgi:hypothetical protein